MSDCKCKVCKDTERWMIALNPQTEEAKDAFDDIMSRLEVAATDATYWRLKYQGKWPDDRRLPDAPEDIGGIVGRGL